MDLEQMRAKLEAIVAQLEQFQAMSEISEEEAEQINALSAEFDALTKKIEAGEKLAQVAAKATTSTRKSEPVTVKTVEVKASKKELQGGFDSYGDFLASVKKMAHGDIDKRFQNNTMFERVGEDGGVLVPEQFIQDIAKKFGEDDSLFARTSQIAVSGNNLTLNIDETAPYLGGVQAYWTAEGSPIQDSKHKFGQASWKLNKLAALVKATDELLEDATALESYIRRMAPIALVHKMNSAIISGNGVGKPTGILNSGYKVRVNAESGQTADTIVAANVVKMYSRLLPASRQRAAWFINPMVESELRLMRDPAGNYIYLAPGSQMNQQPYGLLMGLPVIPLLGSMPQLGDEGDIILADLSAYYTIFKSGGIKQSVSTHLLFDRDISCYKFTMRIDGSCPFKSPVVTEFGNYEMSAIVTLADR